MAETILKSQIILTKYGGPMTAISAQKNRNKKIKEREKENYIIISVYRIQKKLM